ncbi:immunogenic protein MPT63, partial [Mycolicibacterium porcinum]
MALADADDSAVTTAALGGQGKLDGGTQVWTVTDLKPSTDTINYTPHGTLWEVTATNEALQGSVTPIVSNFNIRAADGQNYRALFQVPSSQGVNPATLAQGQKTSGKIYFDVTGDQPTSVVYNAGGNDVLVWNKTAAPASAPAAGAPKRQGPAAAAPAATPAPTCVAVATRSWCVSTSTGAGAGGAGVAGAGAAAGAGALTLNPDTIASAASAAAETPWLA